MSHTLPSSPTSTSLHILASIAPSELRQYQDVWAGATSASHVFGPLKPSKIRFTALVSLPHIEVLFCNADLVVQQLCGLERNWSTEMYGNTSLLSCTTGQQILVEDAPGLKSPPRIRA